MYFIKPTDAFISIRGFLHKKNAVKITALWESTFGRTSAALRLLKDSLLYVEVQILNIYKLPRKNRHPIGCLFSLGSGIRIRTSTYGVRGSQSFFKTAYLSHFSDFVSLKNLYQLSIRNF